MPEDTPAPRIQKVVTWLLVLYIWGAGFFLVHWVFKHARGRWGLLQITGVLVLLISISLAAMIGGRILLDQKLQKYEKLPERVDILEKEYKRHLEVEHGRT